MSLWWDATRLAEKIRKTNPARLHNISEWWVWKTKIFKEIHELLKNAYQLQEPLNKYVFKNLKANTYGFIAYVSTDFYRKALSGENVMEVFQTWQVIYPE